MSGKIIEPKAKDVQDTEVEDTAVILEWKAVVQELVALVESGALEPAANGLVTDFLDFVYETFPFLNPYEKLALCKHNKGLLDNRSARDGIHHHRPRPLLFRWGNFMKFDDGPSRQVKLDAKGTGSVGACLGSSSRRHGQSSETALPRLSVERLSQLQTRGWQVEPNFHLAFRSDNLFWSKGEIPLLNYISFGRSVPL